MKTNNGFTLIELLIVIVILVSLLAMGLASFNTFNRRERLKQTALTLKSTLRFAQTKAISVDKPSAGCTEFSGMRVSFTATSYSVQHECDPEGLVGSIETVTVSNNNITFVSFPSSITFETESPITNLTANQNILLTNGSESYLLIVSPNGGVSDEGFQ